MNNQFYRLIVAIMVFFSLTIFSCEELYAAQTDTIILKMGVKGEAVKEVQKLLSEYGYYDDIIDGIFGVNTKIAIVNFQLDNNLDADGVIGKATMDALKNLREQAAVSRSATRKTGYRIAGFAKSFFNVPYVWGGRSPNGFDCSGYVAYVYDQFGISLPRMADEQFTAGQWVSRRNLQPGDLVFFTTYEPGPSHVGIYIGAEQFIHASSGAGCVTITSMNKPYYFERYLGARRIVE